jgi:hypothetical protein
MKNFSAMERKSYIQWDDDDDHLHVVLDQHA